MFSVRGISICVELDCNVESDFDFNFELESELESTTKSGIGSTLNIVLIMYCSYLYHTYYLLHLVLLNHLHPFQPHPQ